MVQKTIVTIGSLAFLAILFFFIRFLCYTSWVYNMTIDYTIAPIDVISLIVSSLITIWIGWYIVKRLTEQRYDKEFLIDDLKRIEGNVHEIMQTFVVSSQVDISLIAAKINEIHQLKQRFKDTDKLMNKNTSVAELNAAINELYQYTTDFDTTYVETMNVDQTLLSRKCDHAILSARKLIIQINNR